MTGAGVSVSGTPAPHPDTRGARQACIDDRSVFRITPARPGSWSASTTCERLTWAGLDLRIETPVRMIAGVEAVKPLDWKS
jgi:hypothetical protein